MMLSSNDRDILRQLVERYLEETESPRNREARALWRDLNSLRPTRPAIYVRGGRCWSEIPELQELKCGDPFLRRIEYHLRLACFRAGLRDDSVFEPWLTVPAVRVGHEWGVSPRRMTSSEAKGSWKEEPPLKELEDIEKLRMPEHRIDEEATRQQVELLSDAVGDLITIDVVRSPVRVSFNGDLSTDLGHLRGIEQFMLDMYTNPQWLHRLLAFMRDAVLHCHDQAEDAGDWGLTSHENQAMPYAHELPDPCPNTRNIKRSRLWYFCAAQEFTLVSPAMHEEFLLKYQLPILEKFGLVAYGCCEDLTRKIDMLRKIPNLRRIAVAPRADIRECARQIGNDYVMSYRPNPASMVCCGFDATRVAATIGEALEVFRGHHIDITLKDIDTVEHEPWRLQRWVEICRDEIARRW